MSAYTSGRRDLSNFNAFRLFLTGISGCKARVSTLGVETGLLRAPRVNSQ
jgi:hypothetical protein